MSATSTVSLPEAIAHHQRGELPQAEQLYRAILSSEPNHADALHLLGVITLQRGQPRQAVELIERAIAIETGIAAYHANLGEAYRAVGEPQRAIACCQIALRLQPVYPEAANNLGSLLMPLGRVAEAAELFQRAVEQKPDFALAHNNLGNARRILGHIDQAIAHFRRAVALDPQMGFAHGNLGQLLLDCERPRDALPPCREAVRLQPQSAPALNNLGNVFRRLGQLDKAKACYIEALRLAPNLPMIPNNLGHVVQDEGKLPEAKRWFEQALQLSPNSAALPLRSGERAARAGRFCHCGETSADRSAAAPDGLEARLGLAKLYYEQGRVEEAIAEYRGILQAQPNQPVANCLLGELLVELNQMDEALACFRASLRGNPRFAPPLAQLGNYLRDKLPTDEQRAFRRLAADPQLADRDRVSLLFGLAQVCDGEGRYDEAAQQMTEANALDLALRRQSGQSYKAAAHVGFVDQLLTTFTPAFFERMRGFGLDSERPVFIFGLPRSGTTLLEQVLASHSQVFGAGELRVSREDFVALGGSEDAAGEARTFAALQTLDADGVHGLAQHHLERLGTLHASAAHVTDKMPDNYLYLGLLAALFPKAQFLHCRRDMRDVAVSCWITQFRDIPWANDAEDMASRFAQYQRLMEHWQSVLPVPVLDVDYEDMVEDLETVARRVVTFCGLEWQPACLEYHRTHRPIRTASVGQVRQPIYRRSLARWRHYEKALHPLFVCLGLAQPNREELPEAMALAGERGALAP